MKKWNLVLLRQAAKQFDKLPKIIQDLAFEAMADIEQQGPMPTHWDVKKLQPHEYRLRVNYRYRMRYRVIKQQLVIEVFYIGHRKNAYERN